MDGRPNDSLLESYLWHSHLHLGWIVGASKYRYFHTVELFGKDMETDTPAQISLVTYLFDAYPPAGTLAALTAAACTRIAFAGIIPLVIVQGMRHPSFFAIVVTYATKIDILLTVIVAFTNITGAWALSIFGFISIPLIAIPFVLYKWGPALRARSPYSQSLSIHSHMPLTSMEVHRMDDQPSEQMRMSDTQV